LFARGKLALLTRSKQSGIMTLDEASKHIKACAVRMNALYGKPVFDDWAVAPRAHNQSRILSYTGPRNDDFLQNFAKDLGPLRAELLQAKYHAGDFEFARNAAGTNFEVFLVMGDAIYLICNNTTSSMNEIARDPRWLEAQVPFAELSDQIRSSPLKLIA
jgi:hypothetical protein